MGENVKAGESSMSEEYNPGPWTCFHCAETFEDRQCAKLHFGRTEDSTPACIIKGADHGLLRALRSAEEQADDAIQAMHAESTDAAKAYHRQRCRHTQALIAAEESGYERGLHDSGRAEMLDALIEARRAIGDHFAPSDCYATGPLTGDAYRDLVQCPACHAIPLIDAAISKAKGEEE